MQLIEALLIAVSVLALLAGSSVLIGSQKQNKANSVWFFLSTIGATVWSISIAWFLLLGTGQMELAKILVIGIIAGITICDISLLGYCGWNMKGGKISTVLFGLIGAGIVGLLAIKPELFYSDISLNYTCNQLTIVKGWYYVVLICYFTLISLTFSGFLSKKIKKENNKNRKFGLKIFYVGLTIGGILALVFDLIFLTTWPATIWIGPMAVSISILSFYYSVVKYQSISLSSKGMKVMSYGILVATGIMLYILIFYAVFASLFHMQNPSMPVILLNLIMLVILIILYPAIKEVSGIMMSMINTSKMQFDYMRKKLSKINGTNVNLRELAEFLADNMHYEYVALVVKGKVYSSNGGRFSADDIVAIEKIKGNGGMWLPIGREIVKITSQYDISKIAQMKDKNGEVFGQMIFGKKLTKLELDREDIIQHETIVNYAGMVIENGGCKS